MAVQIKFQGPAAGSPAAEALRKAFAAGRLHHAYLFSGPEGCGKTALAVEAALALLCGAAGERPCGACPACRKAMDYNHPDLRLLFPFISQQGFKKLEKAPGPETREEAEGSATDRYQQAFGRAASELLRNPFSAPRGLSAAGEITRPQVGEWVEDLSLPPWEAPCKVAIICEADQMNAEASNLLLKTLEEPPSYGRFFLVSSRPHALLPTVRSRCLALKFTSLAPGPLADYLIREKKADAAKARLAAALSEGSLRRALEFLDPGQVEVRNEAVELLESWAAGSPGPALRLAQGLSDDPPGVHGRRLSWAAVLLRYLGLPSPEAKDGRAVPAADPFMIKLEALRGRLPAQFFGRGMDNITKALGLLDANVPAELVHSALAAAFVTRSDRAGRPGS